MEALGLLAACFLRPPACHGFQQGSMLEQGAKHQHRLQTWLPCHHAPTHLYEAGVGIDIGDACRGMTSRK